MKEHVQDYGVRKWAGDDLIELQSEPLSALQALVSPYAPCILTGCELETVPDGDGDYRLHAGYVALKGRKTVENGAGAEGAGDGAETAAATAENGETTAAEEYVKIVRVTAQTVKQPTVFLTLACTPLSRAYGNGENKAIAYDYTAEVCDVLSEVGDRPYLELVADADNPRLPDTLGITRKLDRDGGEATDTVVKFTETFTETDSVPDRPELKSGSSLGLLMRQIRKWFDELKDLKDLAFKDKVAKGDLTDDLAAELDGKVSQEEGKGLSEANFTTAEKLKLKDIKDNANNYVHPTHASRSSGLYKITVDGSGHVSDVAPVIKSDIMALGIPGQDTVYTHPTHASRASGLYKITVNSSGHVTGATAVTKSDITALGIPGQDTNTVYTHPTTAGYKHIPSGGSSGQYLKYSSSGTAMWANLPQMTNGGNVSSSFTLYPGIIRKPTANITCYVGKSDEETLKYKNVSYINNTGWCQIKVVNNSGVVVVLSEAAKNRNGNTNNAGLWMFTWTSIDIVHVHFFEEAERLA